MAAVGNTVLTLTDWAKRVDPTGKTSMIVEMLSQSNGIMQDIVWVPGNLPTGHRVTVRTSIPDPDFRLFNEGSTNLKSTTGQFDEQLAMLEAWSEVDCKLARLNGNEAAFRLSEARSFIQGMGIKAAKTFFYGNSLVTPKEFTGLAPRYGDITGPENAQNIVDAGGTGSDNTSVWLVTWNPETIFGIFPKGSAAGLQHFDHGEETAETSAAVGGTRLRVYRDQFTWDLGLAVRDWRFAARLCNIDVSALVAKVSAADLFDGMIKLSHRIHDLTAGNSAYYCNRTVFQMLDIQGRDDVQTGGQLTYEEVAGRRIAMFRGIPVRICDALLETEARVV
jgi:hypothetical protein